MNIVEMIGGIVEWAIENINLCPKCAVFEDASSLKSIWSNILRGKF